MASRQSSVSTSRSRPRKRRATVFDAVQGRVTQAGLAQNPQGLKAARKPLRPDEVLFKRKNAPVRYQEDDHYPAHSGLPADQQIPPGELASAIHAYISHLYAQTDDDHVRVPWKCMEETALIAMSILMEETVRSVVGETGDLAFTEADQEDDNQIRRRQNEWTMSVQKPQTNSKDQKRGPAGEMQQSSKSAHDAWTWSDESSAYTSDETVEMD